MLVSLWKMVRWVRLGVEIRSWERTWTKRKRGKKETFGERKVLLLRKRRERPEKRRAQEEEKVLGSSTRSDLVVFDRSSLIELRLRWSRCGQKSVNIARSNQSLGESSKEELSTSRMISWSPILKDSKALYGDHFHFYLRCCFIFDCLS